MIKNYLKIALSNLVKSKGYNAINNVEWGMVNS
jgi:hypothetical protein